MNINNISSNHSIIPRGSNNNEVRLLEKEKLRLQSQLEKLQESKGDNKMKEEQKKLLLEQIQQIDMQIQEKQRENMNIKQKSDQQGVSEKNNFGYTNSSNKEDTINTAGLLQASSLYDQLKSMSRVHNCSKSTARILEVEIKLDEGRGGSTKAKKEELKKVEEKIDLQQNKISEKFNEVSQELNELKNDNSKSDNKNSDDEEFSDRKEADI